VSEPERERCAAPGFALPGCAGLVSGYIEIAGERLPVCALHARAFAYDALRLWLLP
jgi:hypothetical protein